MGISSLPEDLSLLPQEQKYQAVNPFFFFFSVCVATRFPGKRGRRVV